MRTTHSQFALSLLGAMLLTTACNDGRKLVSTAPKTLNTFSTPATLTSASEIRFNGNDTQVMQMYIKGTSLYLTGLPFAFSRWEVSPNPERPTMTFAASERLMSSTNPFAPMKYWDTLKHASGALTLLGNYAFMSGTHGTSVVSLATLNNPIEKGRYPGTQAGDTAAPSDEAFKYKALVAHPTLPLLYGFREQDYFYTLNMTSGGLALGAKTNYTANGSTVCCATSGVAFGNNVYVAFRDRLLVYELGNQGQLVRQPDFTALNATLVTATEHYLYVFHEPIYSQGGVSAAKGLYVFDQSGQHVGYFSMNTPVRFAIAPGDTHAFVNFDNTSIQVLRMTWPTQQQ